MNAPKIITIGFMVVVVFFAAFIFYLFKIDTQSFYQSSIKEQVKAVYTVRGKPLQRSAKLNNNTVIDVPTEFIPYIQAGDSIIKEGDSNLMMLVTFQQHSRTIIIHP